MTPGTSWSADPITDLKLNQAANPVVRLNEQAVGLRELNVAAVAGAIIGGTVLPNFFRNPTFTHQQQTHVHSNGNRINTEASQWWMIGNGTAPLTSDVSAFSSDQTRLSVSGGVGTSTQLLVGQSFGAVVGNLLHNKVITVSVQITNLTTVAFTPTLVLQQYAYVDQPPGINYPIIQSSGVAIAHNETKRVAWTINLNPWGEGARNGFDLWFQISSASLTAVSRSIEFRNAILVQAGADVPFPATTPLALNSVRYDTELPTSTDDVTKGYMPGDEWLLGNNHTGIWRCIANTRNAAVWREVTGIRRIVNRWSATSATPASTTTVVPADDTIPQSTEGMEVFSVTLTPSAIGNRLRFQINGVIDASAGWTITIALFRDSEASARYAMPHYIGAVNQPQCIALTFELTVADLNAQTWKVRLGSNGGTAFWLRRSSGTQYGGVMQGGVIIDEIVNS